MALGLVVKLVILAASTNMTTRFLSDFSVNMHIRCYNFKVKRKERNDLTQSIQAVTAMEPDHILIEKNMAKSSTHFWLFLHFVLDIVTSTQ